MKYFWLHSVRTYIRLGLLSYYRRFKVFDAHHVPKDKPVLFLANHQNALIDPLLIATKSGRFSYFLTRASVFKKPWVSKFLHGLQMLPVYRIRDGWSSISNNNSIFSKCTTLLHQKKAIVIFPEGSHHINRTVRPLSKGFTRIVFETLERYPDTDLQLIPVGINFKKSEDFEDSTALFFGKPIAAKNYLSKDKNEAVNTLKQDVQSAIAALTTHIPAEDYNAVSKTLEDYHVDFLKPQEVNRCIATDFKVCKARKKPNKSLLKQLLKVLLLINFCFPFWFWRSVVKPKIKEIEFMATFRFAVYITVFPLWLIGVTVVLGLIFGWAIALYYFAIVALVALIYVKG